jgi:hypothetical protein
MKYLLTFFSIFLTGQLFAQSTLSSAINKSLPAVFLIRTYDVNDNEIAQGTGFFIDSLGKGVTNYHVLAGASKAQITMSDGREYPIERLWAMDELHDVIGFAIRNTSKQKFKFLKLNSKSPQLGEEVFTIGNPSGLSFTTSNGIVSSVREDEKDGTIIQTTTPISPGSSGSPLLNLKGQVIGIISFSYVNGQNLNFAFSSKYITSMKDNGVNYPYPVDDNPKSPNSKGVNFLMKSPWDVSQSVVRSNESGTLLKDELSSVGQNPFLRYESLILGRKCELDYEFKGGLLNRMSFKPVFEERTRDGRMRKSPWMIEGAWNVFVSLYGELYSEFGPPTSCLSSVVGKLEDRTRSQCVDISNFSLYQFENMANAKFDEFERLYRDRYMSDMRNFYIYGYQVFWDVNDTQYQLFIGMKRYFIIDKETEGGGLVSLSLKKRTD